MMSNLILTDAQFAAALAENVYRRDDHDVPVSLTDDLGITAGDPVGPSLDNSFKTNTSNGVRYFYSDNGFCASVIEKGGRYWITYRGTDSAESFPAGIAKALGQSQTTLDSERKTDISDWANNLLLGLGTTGPSQLDKALELADDVIGTLAGGDESNVVVAGQSLGGGLAGLVSGIKGVKGLGIAPAPFAKVVVPGDPVIGSPDIVYHFYGPSAADQEFILSNHGYTALQIQDFFDKRQFRIDNYEDNLSSFEVDTITGEVLSDGLGTLTELAGALPFDKSNRYDVGISDDLMPNLTPSSVRISANLHSPSLHNLVIRTETISGKKFSDFLKADAKIRYALLDNIAISGPIEHERSDPREPGFGGSGVVAVAGGANPNVLYRALWKTVGDENGFYDQFSARFGRWLSVGTVAQGLSATTVNDYTIHAGVVKLGLQVVRDAIIRTGTGVVGDAGLYVFSGAVQTNPGNGPASGYVQIDLANITGSTENGVTTLPKDVNGRVFGVRDIEYAIWNAFRDLALERIDLFEANVVTEDVLDAEYFRLGAASRFWPGSVTIMPKRRLVSRAC